MKYTEITVEQAKLLQEIADKYGRHWKRHVDKAWLSGRLDGKLIPPHLQRLRNTHGPSWLRGVCSIKPRPVSV